MVSELKKREKKNRDINLSFNSMRRFGVEIEINSFDGESRPVNGKRPAGIEDVALLVQKNCSDDVVIKGYEHTSGNEGWVIKPDASCGIEIVTTPLKGWRGIASVCKVVEALKNDQRIKADSRCSVHAHLEVADLTEDQIGNIIRYWIKCEPCFFDAMPQERKRNRYCQFMGLMNMIQHDSIISSSDLIRMFGDVKYYSMNTHMMCETGHKRKTVEFRMIEGGGSKDPYLIKNWLRLIIHFVERVKDLPTPIPYKEGDRWSSFLWVEPEDVLQILGFNGKYELSKGLQQTKNWLIGRWNKCLTKQDKPGLSRYVSYTQIQDILKKTIEKEGISVEDLLEPNDIKESLYSENTNY